MAESQGTTPTAQNGALEPHTISLHEPSTISPYTTRAVTVSIGNSGIVYTVLQAIIDQYPGLKQRIDPDRPDNPIELREVDEDIGHTLIHFIYTGGYQTLALDSIPNDLRGTTEFRRSVLAYFSALLCGIDKLRDFTKDKMEELSSQITIFDIQRVVEEVSTKTPKSDSWFPSRIELWVKDKLVADDSLLTGLHLLPVIGRSALFDRAVVKAAAEMYSERQGRTGNDVVENHVSTLPKEEQPIAHNGNEHRRDSGLALPTSPAPLGTSGVEAPYEAAINGNAILEGHDLESIHSGADSASNKVDESAPSQTPTEGEDAIRFQSSLTTVQESSAAHEQGADTNGENLKATDSDGETGKGKTSKKSKKVKKRNSISTASRS